MDLLKLKKLDKIIVFDGVCNFCEFWVLFLIKHDSKANLKFVSAQSELGLELQKQYQIFVIEFQTLCFIIDGKALTSSDAVLKIAKHMDGLYKSIYVFKIVPKFIRDWVYSKIAQNRYKVFGQKQSCMVPDQTIKARFL